MLTLAPRRITRSADHDYTYDGKTYPGTTNILKIIDKSGPLMTWAANNTAEAAIELVNELPTMLAAIGPKGVKSALRERGTKKRDDAAQLGTDVHDLADRMIKGETLPEMPETTRVRVEHVARWWEASGWTMRASEAMLINPEMQYGGTLDLLAYDREGRTTLLDYKTGSGVYKEVVLQLTAYADATYIESDKGFFNMPAVDRMMVLHVTTEGAREIDIVISNLERLAWAACRDIYDWTESMRGKKF